MSHKFGTNKSFTGGMVGTRDMFIALDERMTDRHTLNEFPTGTDYLVRNQGVPFLAFEHAGILNRTTVPPNVNTAQTLNRKQVDEVDQITKIS